MELEHEYTDEIVCPWCGYRFSDSWEWEEDNGGIDCDCGKSFDYERIVSVDYSTSRWECGEGKCEYELYFNGCTNPYIYEDKNWTIWRCKVCHNEIIKTANIATDGKPYIIDIDNKSTNATQERS